MRETWLANLLWWQRDAMCEMHWPTKNERAKFSGAVELSVQSALQLQIARVNTSDALFVAT